MELLCRRGLRTAVTKSNDTITLNLRRNFSKVLIVKIDSDFEVQGKLLDRKALPKVKGTSLKLSWADVVS